MQEVWKNVVGYEGLYQVSNLGNVKSMERVVKRIRRGTFSVKERILKKSITGDGYYQVGLSKDGKEKNHKIHRLMAEAFFDYKNKKLVINHKDGNRLNNELSNLELCTQSHNIKEAIRLGTKEPPCLNKIGKLHSRSKPVIQYDKNDNFIREWENARQVERELGYLPCNIYSCCRGIYKSAYGYKWKYKIEKLEKK